MELIEDNDQKNIFFSYDNTKMLPARSTIQKYYNLEYAVVSYAHCRWMKSIMAFLKIFWLTCNCY